MRGAHFSLRWLFGVVSFLALGCGLLMYGSPLLSKLAFTATVVALLGAVSTAVYGSGDRRAFWGGFAAFGFAYLWMVCGTWQSPDGSTTLRERLVTSDLLRRSYELLPSTQSAARVSSTSTAVAWLDDTAVVNFDPYTGQANTTQAGAPNSYQSSATAVVTTPTLDRTDFLTTGHSLFAIFLALLGGTVTRRCSSRQRVVAGTRAVDNDM